MDDDSGMKLLEHNSQVVQAAQDFECAICRDFKPGNHFWKLPNCNHSFCVPCVVQSAKVNNVMCALCRKPWVLGGVGNELARPVVERNSLRIIVPAIPAIILFGGGYLSYHMGMFGTFCAILLGLWGGYSDLYRYQR